MEKGRRFASVRPDGSICVGTDPEIGRLETYVECFAPLHGLREMYLEVARLKPEIEQDGLTTKQIETCAERKLREAGITRLSEEEFDRQTKGWAALYVYVGIVRAPSASPPKYYVYSIYIQLHQDAFLVREPDAWTPVITWWTAGFGGADNLNTVRVQVEGSLDDFVSAYLSINPK